MEEHNPPLSATDPLGARSAIALRELSERAQAAITVRREQATRLEAEITARLDAIASAVADEAPTSTTESGDAERAQAEAKRITAELEDARAAMQLERAAWASEREALEKERAVAGVERSRFDEERAAWDAQRSEFDSQREVWAEERAAIEADRKAWEAERRAWDAERNKLSAKAAKLEADLRAAEADSRTNAENERSAQEQLRQELADLERKLVEERTAHERDQSDWKKERADFGAQLDQAKQKFDLALEDVQRLRTRVNELEQDLARRPETGKADSAELVALRAERDALAARVVDLERSPSESTNSSSSEELDDLRRRFEMAVEDVRELKTKNAKLESQLSAAKQSTGHVAVDGGSMDWESQKRRLLASLEGGSGDEDEPEVQKERATIQSTIEMTDAVVAEKDQIIADLESKLASVGDGATSRGLADREAEIATLVDTDAVIAEHRTRIAKIEQELDAKLRSAELELSVERAKIARQRAELEELRVELESQRTQGHHETPGQPGAPKRRWLSKLGLAGDENEGT